MPVFLQNKILKVEIGEPGEFYSGSRFDHSGNIKQVTLNNNHSFCTTEKKEYNPIFGFGLLNEFDIDIPASYPESKAGGFFLKTGVGTLLKENDEPYNFFHPYTCEPALFKTNLIDQYQVSFENESKRINGFQTFYRKVVSIEKNVLTVDYQLKNTGEKCFSTEEYCHNLIAIDHQKLSDNYVLEFSFDIVPEQFAALVDPSQLITIKEKSISFTDTPNGDIFIAELNGKNKELVHWTLINTRQKAGVTEETSFESTKVNLWGNGHVISPELFFSTYLNPGEEARWQRRYTFFEI